MVMLVKIARGVLWFIYAWVIITLVILSLAFVLQLFGASTTSSFVEWVYRSAERSMAPFRGIFEPIKFSDQSVLDTSMLFAMLVYMIVALCISALVHWLTERLGVAERQAAQATRTQAVAAPDAPSRTRFVQLAGTGGIAGSATLTATPWGTSIELTASGLDPHLVYGVWLELQAGGRVPIGSFRPYDTNMARVSLTTATALDLIGTLGVAVLPEGATAGGIDVLAPPAV